MTVGLEAGRPRRRTCLCRGRCGRRASGGARGRVCSSSMALTCWDTVSSRRNRSSYCSSGGTRGGQVTGQRRAGRAVPPGTQDGYRHVSVQTSPLPSEDAPPLQTGAGALRGPMGARDPAAGQWWRLWVGVDLEPVCTPTLRLPGVQGPGQLGLARLGVGLVSAGTAWGQDPEAEASTFTPDLRGHGLTPPTASAPGASTASPPAPSPASAHASCSLPVSCPS